MAKISQYPSEAAANIQTTDYVLGNSSTGPATQRFTWANVLTFIFKNVPWSTSTMPYKFRAYRNASLSSSSTPIKVAFDTETFDTNNNFDITTNVGRYTVPLGGYYFFTAVVGNTTAGATPIFANIYKNGVQYTAGSGANSASNGTFSNVQDLIKLIAGDFIEIYFVGGNGSTVGVGSSQCSFAGYFVIAI